MPQETQTQADHTLAEPTMHLLYHFYGSDNGFYDLEDFLYFLVCTTSLDARDLVKAIEQFTATKP